MILTQPLRSRFTALGLFVVMAVASLALVIGTGRGALAQRVTPSSGGAPVASQAGAGAHGVLGPGLAALARRHPLRSVSVIVQVRGQGAAARHDVLAAGGSMQAQLPLIGGFAARLPAGAAAGLAGDPGVRVVSLNAEVQGTSLPAGTLGNAISNLVTSYDSAVDAPAGWLVGATGSGVGVAVIDTGIAGNLPDFQVSANNSASRVVASAVVNPMAQDANDTYGHGTHVAGIIAGNGWDRGTSDPLDGKYIGVAPQANLISIKADDGNGNTTVLDLIDGLQFAVDHQSQFNIRVVNLSVRSTVAQSYTTDPLDAAVEQAWLKGIVVVAAAGNLGSSSDAVNYAPANDPYAITVGAVDDEGTRTPNDDVLASWSSRGVTQDGFAKPDVLAPGAH